MIYDDSAVIKYLNRWIAQGVFLEVDEYKLAFKFLHHLKITKCQDFQYHLLLNKIVNNKDLCDWGKRDNPNCLFCSSVDDIMHMLFHCIFVKPFIEWITNIVEDNNIKIEMNLKTFILSCLHERQNHIINFISVCIKQYLLAR